MSIARDMLAAAVAVRQDITGEPCKNLRTGLTFIAEVEEIADLSLNEALGIDPRASVIFHILDRTVAINTRDIVTCLGGRWEILCGHTPDNPASLQLKFYAMKLETKDAA